MIERILAVQEVDTAIDQLRHRRANLPERTRLDEVNADLAAVDARRSDVAEQQAEIAAAERRLEDEIAAITAKSAQVDRTLYSGTVSAPRELQAMQDELAALGRRQRALEDQALERMEQLEPIEAELASLASEQARLDAEAITLLAAIAEAEVEIEAELASLSTSRAAAAEGVPDSLLGEYETLRARLGGIGAARLVGSSCMGCHLALPAVEIDRIRHLPPDEIVHCDECGRLLVRT